MSLNQPLLCRAPPPPFTALCTVVRELQLLAEGRSLSLSLGFEGGV